MVALTPAAANLPADSILQGLSPEDLARVQQAIAAAHALYGADRLSSGEPIIDHTLGMAGLVASLALDADTRIASLMFAAHALDPDIGERLQRDFGPAVAGLVEGLHRLNGLRVITRSPGAEFQAQTEILRKMLLAMVEDIRVVLLRLASRTQSLRWYADHPGPERLEVARETLAIYAPLANRLGVGRLKWELEDRAFCYLEPEHYQRIAALVDETRVQREQFIAAAVDQLETELARAGIKAVVTGRAKHLYSIWNKMARKRLAFSGLHDLRALRVLVDDVEACYRVLGVVHALWTPVENEFDDYIAQPKENHYQSLHTVVSAEDGRSLEVQIRTRAMHEHAEMGVASHWRYKEGGPGGDGYDQKIALLRQLLSWRDEVAGSPDWSGGIKRAALDDTIYVLTPQGKVIDLPQGATPVDFAYRLHSELGHRCRGAKVNGQLVPLNTPLKNAQKVEVIAAKQGAPSRDWLNPALGYLVSARARQKVKQWFAQQDEQNTLAAGRAFIHRELSREGAGGANIDTLAATLGHRDATAMYLAAGRGEIGPRAISVALGGGAAPLAEPHITARPKAQAAQGGVLVEGVDKLLTQLGQCCKPVPPDAIAGFITRGRGVSIHRPDCVAFQNMSRRAPERVIEADWGRLEGRSYSVDIALEAADRQGLLRDISDVLSREKINVTAVRTQSKGARAFMGFTLEVSGLEQLKRALVLIAEVPSVESARRA